MNTPVETYINVAREGRCDVHGPWTMGNAMAHAARIVAERMDGGIAAMAGPGDGFVDALELRRAVNGVLTPTTTDWAAMLPHAAVGVASAAFAVAEVGAVVVAASAAAPRGLSAVPPCFVAFVDIATIVETIDDGFAKLAGEPLASNVSWISGPSRTGDLEMTLTWGVHGPKQVDVILIDAND